MTEWMCKGARAVIGRDARPGGAYAGLACTLVKRDGRQSWMVKLDGGMFGLSVPDRGLTPA